MKEENGKIIQITENELFRLYLDREFDNIMPYNEYKAKFIALGTEVISNEQ